MTVYAVHEEKEDRSPALKFGEIVYVNRFYIHGDELEQDGLHYPGEPQRWTIPAGYRLNMERAAAGFNPDLDFLLISGDHLQLLAFMAMLVGKYGFVSVLRWDRQLREYIPVRLHSRLVPSRQTVLSSGTHIGDIDAEEARRNAKAVALESPLVGGRRDYTPEEIGALANWYAGSKRTP